MYIIFCKNVWCHWICTVHVDFLEKRYPLLCPTFLGRLIKRRLEQEFITYLIKLEVDRSSQWFENVRILLIFSTSFCLNSITTNFIETPLQRELVTFKVANCCVNVLPCMQACFEWCCTTLLFSLFQYKKTFKIALIIS